MSLVNQHQPKCKWRKYWLLLTGSTGLLGKLRARLWSEHFLHRIHWKYNSDGDIWLCKWVQTICQAICHLEQLHFANAGRRHRRFLLYNCATLAWGLWWCCSAPLHVSASAPGEGTRNCKGGRDFWILTWITLKSQMSICLWLVLSSEVSPDTKYGGTEHLGKKNLLQSPFQTFCILNEGKAWHGAAESSPAWEQKWELKDYVQTHFHSSWQLKLFNLNNKTEIKRQKPSPVSMQEKHPPLQKQGTSPSFGTGHQSHVGGTFHQTEG